MKISKQIIYLFSIQLFFISNIFGQFSNPILIESNSSKITNILTVDINNDNLKDIIVTRKFSNSIISYYLNLGNQNFSQETIIDSGISHVTNIALGDFNNDNWIDIVSIGDESNSVTVFINNALTFNPQVIDNFTFFESDIEVTDIDNDDDLDIIAVGGSILKVYYNNSMANFTAQTISGPIEDFFDITINDIDSDGFEDILTGGFNISVYKNNNGTISYDSARSGTIPSTFNLFLRLEDLDNDGDVDLFSEDNNSSGVRWMANDGNGNFSNLQIIDSNALNIRSGTINDFDNDGDLDIMLAKNLNIVLYTNDGLGNFSSPFTIQNTSSIISVIHSDDMNIDGLPDLIWSADLNIQLNDLTVSINDNLIDDNIKIFPNPSFDHFNIESLEKGTLTIFNIQGQLIQKDIEINNGINYINIDLNPQLYFIKINTKSKTIIKKILIK